LTHLKRYLEAEEARLAALRPTRNPNVSPDLIRLDRYYNASLYDPNWHDTAADSFDGLA